MVPNSGSVVVRGRIAPLIELGAGFHPELSGRENIYLNATILGLKRKEIDARFKEITTFADLGEFIDTPIKHYSSGMYMRLAFAVAVHTDPDILLVDEILAVGDTKFQERCFQKMREFQNAGVAIIFVSHDMRAIQNFCTRVFYINSAKIVKSGEPKEVIKKYALEVL
jgi:ABC-2 type transport system ATP-binding protein